MSISPYVEAPTIRTTIQPTTGGLDTSSFDPFRQGVSNRSIFRQNLSLLPQMGTGKSNFQDFDREFGQSQSFVASEPYVDNSKVTALGYLQNPEQYSFPIYVGDFVGIDGAIEPLSIRSIATRETIESPTISHSIKGTLIDGNENTIGASDRIQSYYEVPGNSQYDYYLDSADRFGNISYPGLDGDGETIIRPHSDTVNSKRKLTNDAEINEILLAMTGSIDDEFLPNNTKAATSGFVYNISAGTDSLAFGGLLNS